MNLEDGVRDELKGIVGGPGSPVYFHKVKIRVGTELFETLAGFSDRLAVAGILGRRGFFDNFTVIFDASSQPPCIEANRVYHA